MGVNDTVDPIGAFFNEILNLIVWVVGGIAFLCFLLIVASIFSGVATKHGGVDTPNVDEDFCDNFCEETQTIKKNFYYIKAVLQE